MTGPEISTRAPAHIDVDVVIPVYNEAQGLDRSIRTLHAYLSSQFPLSWTITIADNASTDATLGIAGSLASELAGVRVLHLDRKGRGRALRAAWGTSDASVVAYMDVDLSTGLDALLPLVAPLLSGHSDVAIGTRLAAGSRIVRGPRREVISRIYNRIVRSTLRTSFSDAQCGFKAVRSDVVRDLLPLVEDDGWFFDTELLAIAEHNGLRIHEVPVDWIDDPESSVDVVKTARDDLVGVGRTFRRLAGGYVSLSTDRRQRPVSDGWADQLVRFGSIGLVSTVVASALFLVMAPAIGTVAANVVAFSICALLNAGANRCVAASLRTRSARSRHFVGNLVLGAVPLVISTLVLIALDLDGITSLAVALAAVFAVNLTMAVLRFLVVRRWTGIGDRTTVLDVAVSSPTPAHTHTAGRVAPVTVPFSTKSRTQPASADT